MNCIADHFFNFILNSFYKKWQFNINSNYYPVVIECRPVNERLAKQHAHVTLAYIDKTIHSTHIKNTPTADSSSTTTTSAAAPPAAGNATGEVVNNNSGYSLQSHLNNSHSYQMKPIKQKQFIDGVLYSLQVKENVKLNQLIVIY